MTFKQTKDQRDAADAFAGLFGFILWVKKHAIPLLVGGSLVGGGTTVFNRCTEHPTATQNVSVQSESPSSLDSLESDVRIIASGMGNEIAMTSMLQNKVDNMAMDLNHIPAIRAIDKARQDSIRNANSQFLTRR